MKEILCKTCMCWVDCGKKDGKPYGFCLMEPLFSFTARTRCNDYENGAPVTEQEYEDFNRGK